LSRYTLKHDLWLTVTGIVKKATKAKVAVFTSGLDVAQTETKGTVLLKNADEMLNFTRGEEKQMEKVSRHVFLQNILVLFMPWFRSSKRLQTLALRSLSLAHLLAS
jgi:hypothetical protein